MNNYAVSLEILLISLVLLPLIGSMTSYILGTINKGLSGWVASLFAILSFVVSIILTNSIISESSVVTATLVQNWIELPSLKIDLALYFDSLSALMSLIITGVGSLIHLYSISYMKKDESVHRFFSYLNLFLFFMLLLVLGSNLLTLFVGWEGVGLCSYLLISFWFSNYEYSKAGMKAFVVNRVGDIGLLLAMFIIAKIFGTLEFIQIKSGILGLIAPESLCTILGLLIFFACTGKSAQIPLFVWLPDAMAGPTPVSALIHAATMVTAGVYLTARMFYVFDNSPYVQAVICLVGVLTALISAVIAVTQSDIKKILAYSTISQLGFMFVALSCGNYWIALFHVVTHAFFKACLFLSAGSVIHGCYHEQDVFKMGGLRSFMPITFLCYAVATFAIAGIYPFSGYFSKHLILQGFSHYQNIHIQNTLPLLKLSLNFTALLTAFYMTRSLVLVFFGEYKHVDNNVATIEHVNEGLVNKDNAEATETNSNEDESHHNLPHESPILMTLPLVVLSIFSLLSGILLENSLPEFLASSIKPYIDPNQNHHAGVFSHLIDSLPPLACIIIAFLVFREKNLPTIIAKHLQLLYSVSKNKFYVDEIYDYLISKPLKIFIKYPLRWFEDILLTDLIFNLTKINFSTSRVINLLHTGLTSHISVFLLIVAGVFCLYVF